MEKYDVIIIGSGPAGLGNAFRLIHHNPNLKIAIVEQSHISSGGLRNDGKQIYGYPICFGTHCWEKSQAESYLYIVKSILIPQILPRGDMSKYIQRINRTDRKISMIEVDQSHIGTDKSSEYISKLINILKEKGVTFFFNCEFATCDEKNKEIMCVNNKNQNFLKILRYNYLVIATGRQSMKFLQNIMDQLQVVYTDNILDIGIRVEAKIENYSIVNDYYDPKIYFPENVRTFCTNSGYAIVKRDHTCRYSVNGHALSAEKGTNGLVNFALLKTIGLTEPITSGREFADILGKQALGLSDGKLIMQRVGDFRCKKRSTKETFNNKNLGHDFLPTYQANPGDVALGPLKIIQPIWEALKYLDKVVPGILHPSTIMYYPEIKLYANRPTFLDQFFQVFPDIYMIGDGVGTSRGITGAWASGARAADGIVANFKNK